MKRLEGINSLSPLLSLSPILHHSSQCFLHLSVWHVQTAAIIQLDLNASVVLLALFLSLHIQLSVSFIHLSTLSVFHPLSFAPSAFLA